MNPLNIDYVLNLYEQYRDDLLRVEESQKIIYNRKGVSKHLRHIFKRIPLALYKRLDFSRKFTVDFLPQLDDIEAEITYLRLRDTTPETVVEISPCGGWSTTWILQSLKDNKRGILYSYDMIDRAPRNIPRDLVDKNWEFFKGDITQKPNTIPEGIDYLFMDSDHSGQFAQWYVETIFPRVKHGAPVSVHDVYHANSFADHASEPCVIVKWLKDNNIRFFSPSPYFSNDLNSIIRKKRSELGLPQQIHSAQNNSIVFFNLP